MQRAVGVPVTVVEVIGGLMVIFVAAGLAFSSQRSYWARVFHRRRQMSVQLQMARDGG